jgi:3-methyladenine DNA glycosylase/8-oxoguanine DNA glycosylase
VYDTDEAVRLLCAADPKLARLIERVGPPRLKPRIEHSIFYSLLRSIIYQQLAGKAAAAILGRVDALFAPDGVKPKTGVRWLHKHVTPEAVLAASDERLRSAGLSRNKMAALRDLAAKTLDGTVPTLAQTRRMTEEELIERLTAVRGVGQWTVEMLLIFRLGRPDVLPLDDYGIRKGFKLTFHTRELPTKQQLLRRGERWRPYRSLASWYLWRAVEA